MMMGGTASQDGNLAQLSKVSKEKPPKKKPHQVRKPFLNATSDYNRIVNIAESTVYTKKNYGIIQLIINKY